MLKQNLDFIAVALIALVLGVVQAPRLGVRVARIAMEQQQVMQMHNVRFEGPVRVIPPMPPQLCKKLQNFR